MLRKVCCPNCNEPLNTKETMYAPYCDIDVNYDNGKVIASAYMCGKCPKCDKIYQWDLSHECDFANEPIMNFEEMNHEELWEV